MSLNQLNQFLADARQKVDDVARKVGEIQTQFVSAYQESKAKHDATLNNLSLRAAYNLSALPAEVRQEIDKRLETERETLEKRRQELLSHVAPKAEQIADDLLTRAQQTTAEVRTLNPRLNEQEEKIKADLAEMQIELDRLNTEIKNKSGCLTLFVNFFALNDLDRQRQKLLGRMEEYGRELTLPLAN